jgi:hypothetical protein
MEDEARCAVYTQLPKFSQLLASGFGKIFEKVTLHRRTRHSLSKSYGLFMFIVHLIQHQRQ